MATNKSWFMLFALACTLFGSAAIAEEMSSSNDEPIPFAPLKPIPPPHRYGLAAQNEPVSGVCAHSILETRVPWMEAVSGDASTRPTMVAIRHPDRNICGSYIGKDSCCTAETLKGFVEWADAMDASMQLTRYYGSLIQRDPHIILDQILVILRAQAGDPNKIDWKAVREKYREKVATLIQDFWTTMSPGFSNMNSAFITYHEGLLCSICEPHFERFMDSKMEVKMREQAATSVADAVVDLMAKSDQFLTSPAQLEHIQDLVYTICLDETQGDKIKCLSTSTIVSLVVSKITGSSLRQMMCNTFRDKLVEQNDDCKNVVMHKVLRGLHVDWTPIINNIFGYLVALCPSGFNCNSLDPVRQKFLEFFFTFDERPLATNVYSTDGYDVQANACLSNLSGFACGKDGPEPEEHKGDVPAENGSAGIAILITLLVLFALGVLGAFLYKFRYRIKRLTHDLYVRLVDQDERGSGPTVGLV